MYLNYKENKEFFEELESLCEGIVTVDDDELKDKLCNICHNCKEYQYLPESDTEDPYNYCRLTTIECFDPSYYIACPYKYQYYDELKNKNIKNTNNNY